MMRFSLSQSLIQVTAICSLLAVATQAPVAVSVTLFFTYVLYVGIKINGAKGAAWVLGTAIYLLLMKSILPHVE